MKRQKLWRVEMQWFFAMEARFSKLVIEGDNSTVMRAISGLSCHNSLLGHIYEDICAYLNGM